MRGGALDVAFVTPNELLVVDEVQLLTGRSVRPLIAPLSVVEGLIEFLYNTESAKSHGFIASGGKFEQIERDEGDDEDSEPDDEILHLDHRRRRARSGRIVRMVNQILEQALRTGPATSISSRSRTVQVPATDRRRAPRARPAETHVRHDPLAVQDAGEDGHRRKAHSPGRRHRVRRGDKRVDLRVNTVPTVYGEKMVMRLLDKGHIPLN